MGFVHSQARIFQRPLSRCLATEIINIYTRTFYDSFNDLLYLFYTSLSFPIPGPVPTGQFLARTSGLRCSRSFGNRGSRGWCSDRGAVFRPPVEARLFFMSVGSTMYPAAATMCRPWLSSLVERTASSQQ
jgi:hypothetical protein